MVTRALDEEHLDVVGAVLQQRWRNQYLERLLARIAGSVRGVVPAADHTVHCHSDRCGSSVLEMARHVDRQGISRRVDVVEPFGCVEADGQAARFRVLERGDLTADQVTVVAPAPEAEIPFRPEVQRLALQQFGVSSGTVRIDEAVVGRLDLVEVPGQRTRLPVCWSSWPEHGLSVQLHVEVGIEQVDDRGDHIDRCCG